MLLTEHPWTTTAAESTPPQAFELRLHGGTEDEQLISLPSGKHSVGSGPRCSVRLQGQGVQPLHCLIVHDGEGLRVRRWANDMLLNGVPFDEASLAPGDRLSVGPIELEIVLSTPDRQPARPFDAAPPVDLPDFPLPQFQPVHWESADYEQEASGNRSEPASAAAAGELFDHLRTANSVARGRSRRLLAALRRRRDEYDELVERMNDLVQKVQSVLAEPNDPLADATQDPPDWPAVEERKDNPEPDADDGQLESELFDVKGQLAARECELVEARSAIDMLERQLSDSQHSLHAFAEERAVWEEQLTKLESRLADYAARIQELERQLVQVRESQANDATIAQPITLAWPDTPSPSMTPSTSTSAIVGPEPATAIPAAPPSPWDASAGEGFRDAEASLESQQAESHERAEDVDDPLVHLRGLSVWQDRPDDAAEADSVDQPTAPDEANPPAPTPAGDQESSETKGPRPASFITRFANLFANDEAGSESPAPEPQSVVAGDVEPTTHLDDSTGDDRATSQPPAVGHGDEESIEQYMSRLWQRVRGDSTDDAPPPRAAVDSVQVVPVQDSQAAAATEDTASIDPPPMTLEDLKSKVTAPELASDLVAMRALANQSARHAIGVHTAGKLRRTALTRFVIALLAGTVGLYCMIDSPGMESGQFFAAWIALVVSVYWWHLTFQALVQAVRVGAFEEYEVKIAGDVPPLPIDVER